MNICRVKTLEEALELVKNGAGVLAGGTNLFVDFKKKGIPDKDYADISGLAELKKICKDPDGSIRLGALVTFRDLLKEFGPETALYQAAYDMGSPQVRNRATIAGNICDASPACDMGPVLLALNAKAVLCSENGTREVPVTDFFKNYRVTEKQPDEILTEIVIPASAGKSIFRKIGLRNALAISVVSLSAAETEAGICLAMGSVAETPVRLTHCEVLIKEKKISAEDLRQALSQDIHPVTDIRAGSEYRFETALNLLCDVLGKEFGYDIV